MCLSAQVLLVMYFMANNIGFGLRTLFYELLFTGVCVIVLFIAFHWLANSKAIRDYPKCKKDCYNQNDIAFINAILADHPLECTIVKAYQRNESYFIYTENEAFDVTKFITDRSQYSTELEIVQLEYIRHTAISEDGDPDSICMENYICLRQKGSAFTSDEPISETEKEEIMTIYNNRFSFIEVYP